MAHAEARDPREPDPKRCPVCWTPFTPHSTRNPNPQRYCSDTCRKQDWKRRRQTQEIQRFLATKPESLPAANTDAFRVRDR